MMMAAICAGLRSPRDSPRGLSHNCYSLPVSTRQENFVTMPTIDPFALDPSGSFAAQRFTLYWFASVLNLSYEPPAVPRATLYDLAGATAVTASVGPGGIFPSADISVYPGARALVAVRGTTTGQQLITEIAGIPLAPIPPWAGQVGIFWATSSAALYLSLRPALNGAGATHVVWSGHSLGAAIATLGPDLAVDAGDSVCDGICTLGGPRVGSLAFSESQTYRHWRLTNQGDPVPCLPPSGNAVLDRTLWILAPAALTQFWHTGTRAHLLVNSLATFPPDQSTWADAQTALVSLLHGLQSWYNDHNPVEYARRLRQGIPTPFNQVSAEYPGIEVLDNYWVQQNTNPPAATWLEPRFCGH